MEARDLLNIPKTESPRNDDKGSDATFVLSSSPLVPVESPGALAWDEANQDDPPRYRGRSVLFGIARDPHTLFMYWEIDWRMVFATKRPADRRVHLRVTSADGGEEIKVAVEPLAKNHSVTVSQARSAYRIEIGYYEPVDVWHSVATSDMIATPPDDVSNSADIDVATIPFHLNFQRMVDALRASNYDGDALVDVVGRLQEKLDDPIAPDLAAGDWEILRTLEGASVTGSADRSRLRMADEILRTRQRIESILGFGAASPSPGFGSSRRN